MSSIAKMHSVGVLLEAALHPEALPADVALEVLPLQVDGVAVDLELVLGAQELPARVASCPWSAWAMLGKDKSNSVVRCPILVVKTK